MDIHKQRQGTKTMSDLISRKDAIAKFKKSCTSESIDKNGIKRGEIHTAMTYEGIIKIIESLPSAEPERKWWCNLCSSYDEQSCYCNLYGIFTASDFGCRDFGAYCEEDGDD